MRRFFALALAALATFALVYADFADAARMGGGRSFGMQRSIVPKAAPSTGAITGPAARPVMPATPGAQAARPAPGVAAPAGTGPRTSRWLGPIAGIAAGLGLAALLSHFGLSPDLGGLLLIGLIAVVAIALVRALAARRAGSSPWRYEQPPAAARDPFANSPVPAIDTAWGTPIDATATASPYPPGFEPGPFVAQAKQQFRRLQAAYDRGDRALLSDVTTPQMQAEIARELEARGPHIPTDVVTLDAEVVEVVQEGDRFVASVRFHGTLREDGSATPQPFEELWHLVKPVDGSSGWLLAGIQQYA